MDDKHDKYKEETLRAAFADDDIKGTLLEFKEPVEHLGIPWEHLVPERYTRREPCSD